MGMAAWGLSLKLCLYACLSVTGLRLKYMGLHIAFCHVPLMMQSRNGHFEVEDSEDRNRRQNSPEIWKMVNYSTKERRDNGDRRRLTL